MNPFEKLTPEQLRLLDRYSCAVLELRMDHPEMFASNMAVHHPAEFRSNVKLDFIRSVENGNDTWDRLKKIYENPEPETNDTGFRPLDHLADEETRWQDSLTN